MKKVAFHTLGCKLNFSETSSISRLFEEKGYKKVQFGENADVVVINTCSVTDNADKTCRNAVRTAKKHAPEAFVAVIGCYAQLQPNEIAELPGVDAVLGAAEKFKLLELLQNFEKGESTRVFASEISEASEFNHAHSFGDRTRTFLKVQDGCNYNCSFCTIPSARGKSRSDSITNIIQEARRIAQTEVKEIVLTGVNTGDFGIQNGRRKERFIDLIKQLDEIEGIDRFRISSIEPNLLTNEIIELVAESKRFVPHFHIPLQSGSDTVLKAMRRRYDKTLYQERVDFIKSLMPYCCIGVDVIVGFPGETEEHFLETYRFLNELDISYLHVFPYSERSNTPAVMLEEVVPVKERRRRADMLRILSEKKKRLFYEQNIGRTERVLFENKIEAGKVSGFTDNYVRVAADHAPELVNSLKEVRLLAVSESGYITVETAVSVS